MDKNDIFTRLDLLIDALKGKVMFGFWPIVDAKKLINEQDQALRVALAYIEKVGEVGEGGTCDHEVTLDVVRTAIRNCAGT